MELRPQLQLQAVIKALVDVVIPAVNPGDKLAQEQAQFVVATLQLLQQRLPLMYRYERDELARFIALARTLQEQAVEMAGVAASLHELAASVATGEDVLDRARADPAELEAANLQLRATIGAAVQALYSHNEVSSLKALSSSITAHAKEQLVRERAWLIAQGWEADPKSLPPIETLIDTVPRSSGA